MECSRRQFWNPLFWFIFIAVLSPLTGRGEPPQDVDLSQQIERLDQLKLPEIEKTFAEIRKLGKGATDLIPSLVGAIQSQKLETWVEAKVFRILPEIDPANPTTADFLLGMIKREDRLATFYAACLAAFRTQMARETLFDALLVRLDSFEVGATASNFITDLIASEPDSWRKRFVERYIDAGNAVTSARVLKILNGGSVLKSVASTEAAAAELFRKVLEFSFTSTDVGTIFLHALPLLERLTGLSNASMIPLYLDNSEAMEEALPGMGTDSAVLKKILIQIYFLKTRAELLERYPNWELRKRWKQIVDRHFDEMEAIERELALANSPRHMEFRSRILFALTSGESPLDALEHMIQSAEGNRSRADYLKSYLLEATDWIRHFLRVFSLDINEFSHIDSVERCLAHATQFTSPTTAKELLLAVARWDSSSLALQELKNEIGPSSLTSQRIYGLRSIALAALVNFPGSKEITEYVWETLHSRQDDDLALMAFEVILRIDPQGILHQIESQEQSGPALRWSVDYVRARLNLIAIRKILKESKRFDLFIGAEEGAKLVRAYEELNILSLDIESELFMDVRLKVLTPRLPSELAAATDRRIMRWLTDPSNSGPREAKSGLMVSLFHWSRALLYLNKNRGSLLPEQSQFLLESANNLAQTVLCLEDVRTDQMTNLLKRILSDWPEDSPMEAAIREMKIHCERHPSNQNRAFLEAARKVLPHE